MTFIYALNGDNKDIGLIIISNFNQEGGKVTGNIGKVEVISRQNTSTTTGGSLGGNPKLLMLALIRTAEISRVLQEIQ